MIWSNHEVVPRMSCNTISISYFLLLYWALFLVINNVLYHNHFGILIQSLCHDQVHGRQNRWYLHVHLHGCLNNLGYHIDPLMLIQGLCLCPNLWGWWVPKPTISTWFIAFTWYRIEFDIKFSNMLRKKKILRLNNFLVFCFTKECRKKN